MKQDYKLAYGAITELEIMTLAEAKIHLRVIHTDEDAYITALIKGARQWIEKTCNRTFVPVNVTMYLDNFPTGDNTRKEGPKKYAIEVPFPPLASVTTLSYVDTNGVTQTLTVNTDFKTYNKSLDEPGLIVPAYNAVWPITRDIPDAVTIVMICGYASSSVIPAAVKQACYEIVANHFENREEIVVGTIATKLPKSADVLLAPYKNFYF